MLNMNEYMKKRWNRRRLHAIAHLGAECAQCGDTDRLEFDHVDPSTKSFTIAHGSSFSDEKFWAEIDKCQLLCYSCHREKHRSPHGTLARYRDCRCNLCVTAKRDYNRMYRKKKSSPS